MRSRALATAWLAVVALLLPVGSAQASVEADPPPVSVLAPALNVCEELDLVPCPEELTHVEPTSVSPYRAAGCYGTYSTYGPGTQVVNDPVWGRYNIRYFLIGSSAYCTLGVMTVTAQSVPANTQTGTSVNQDSDACVLASTCFASAGWGHSEFLVGPTPVCFHASASATIGVQAYGPWLPGGGLICV